MQNTINNGIIENSYYYNHYTANLEIIEKQWFYNKFKVELVRYRNIDRIEDRIYQDIDQFVYYRKTSEDHPNSSAALRGVNLKEKTVLQIIESYQKCQVTIDNKAIRFLNSSKSWKLEKSNLKGYPHNSGNLSLLCEANFLQWHLTFSDKRVNQTMPFKEAFVLSKRCSSFVKKMIQDASITTLKKILMEDFVLKRIINNKSIELELTENAKKRDSEIKDCNICKIVSMAGSVLSLPTSISFATTAVITTSVFFGGGFLAMIPAGFTGFYSGTLPYVLGLMPGEIMNDFKKNKQIEKNKKIQAIEKQYAPKLQPHEFLVEFEPISRQSKIDTRACVSKFMWAVTVLTGPKGRSKCHASIVIEGLATEAFRKYVDDKMLINEYFMLKTEINPPIKFSYYLDEKFKKDLNSHSIERTELWMRSSDKVIEMLKLAIKEKIQNEIREKNGEVLKFNILGKKSFLCFGDDKKDGHSCFTWARELVSMLEIDLGEGWFEKIILYPRNFTKPFDFYEKMPIHVEL